MIPDEAVEAAAKILSEHIVITDGLYKPTGWCATCGNLADGDQENHQAFALLAAGYSKEEGSASGQEACCPDELSACSGCAK